MYIAHIVNQLKYFLTLYKLRDKKYEVNKTKK